MLAELIGDILPPGVLNVVNGFGIEAGKPLAQNKRIAKIAFTGETTTGPADHAVRVARTSSRSRWSSAASRRTSSSPT